MFVFCFFLHKNETKNPKLTHETTSLSADMSSSQSAYHITKRSIWFIALVLVEAFGLRGDAASPLLPVVYTDGAQYTEEQVVGVTLNISAHNI